MKSEEKLNHLFETLKAEKASTSVSDVTAWINTKNPSLKINTTKNSIILKSIIMSTIITVTLIGGVILISGKNEDKTIKKFSMKNNSQPKEIFSDSVKMEITLPINKEKTFQYNKIGRAHV